MIFLVVLQESWNPFKVSGLVSVKGPAGFRSGSGSYFHVSTAQVYDFLS